MIFKNRDYIIHEHMDFILHVTENICKKRILPENDDELSIAIIAFNKACDTYDSNKGDFKAYCRRVIKNSLIDYFRKNDFTPLLVDEDSLNIIDLKSSMDNYAKNLEKLDVQDVILDFNKSLNQYNISLSDLVKCSPKHKDTRDNLLKLCKNLYINTEFMAYLYSKKSLNINIICTNFNVKRKLIDKWRKYIIAILLVLSSSEFTYLKSYLNLEMVGDTID